MNTPFNNGQTRTEKANAQAKYIEASKWMKKKIRPDKRKYVENPPETARKPDREGKHETTIWDNEETTVSQCQDSSVLKS